jgi:hypothetical protein
VPVPDRLATVPARLAADAAGILAGTLDTLRPHQYATGLLLHVSTSPTPNRSTPARTPTRTCRRTPPIRTCSRRPTCTSTNSLSTA